MNPDEAMLMEKRFEAGAFGPGLPEAGVRGKLNLTSSLVRFESAQGNLELPVAGLKVAPGGQNDALIFLTHPSQPETSIHTADQTVLRHPVLAGNPVLAMQGRRARTKMRWISIVLLMSVALVAGAVLALVLARHKLVDMAVRSVPVEWEVKAGESVFGPFIKSKHEITDAVLQEQLEKITAPLVAGIGDDRYPLKFHVIEDETLNAFALPGGNVVIHSGLLLAADSAEEVAGVLAHEIAHVTRRHSIRNMVSSAGLYAVLQSVVGDGSGLIAVLANNSAFLLDRKFSRDFEREADETGWEFLLRSDIEPRGMIRFFERVLVEDKKTVESERAQGALAVVSTHPATRERIEKLEAKWKRLEKKSGYRRFNIDYGEFKKSLRTKVEAGK